MVLAILIFALISYGIFEGLFAMGRWVNKTNPNNQKNMNKDNTLDMITNNDNTEHSTAVITEHTPSEEIKEIILTNNSAGVLLYKDYWYKYELELRNGLMSLVQYRRNNDNGTSMQKDDKYYNLAQFGKCNSIEDIYLAEQLTRKDSWPLKIVSLLHLLDTYSNIRQKI